jgi:hypothetical protein
MRNAVWLATELTRGELRRRRSIPAMELLAQGHTLDWVSRVTREVLRRRSITRFVDTAKSLVERPTFGRGAATSGPEP